jgi:hypothetical protein
MASHHLRHDVERRSNPWRLATWGGAACLLLLPLAAMRWFPGSGVDWTLADFVVMGALLSIACGACELVWRATGFFYRAAAGIAILTGFLTVWVNLAVGMIGDEGNPYNLLFAGVLAIAVCGAAFARLQARGMALAMAAAALVQATIAGVALAGGSDVLGALCSGAFAAPWLLSAMLFEVAGRRAP